MAKIWPIATAVVSAVLLVGGALGAEPAPLHEGAARVEPAPVRMGVVINGPFDPAAAERARVSIRTYIATDDFVAGRLAGAQMASLRGDLQILDAAAAGDGEECERSTRGHLERAARVTEGLSAEDDASGGRTRPRCLKVLMTASERTLDDGPVE